MTTPEPASSPASDADSTAAAENDGSDDGGEKGGKGEDGDGEKNGEEEEEKDEKGTETKSGGDPDAVEKQVNGSVAKDPPAATPDSTAKEKGGSRKAENSTAPSSGPEERVEKNTSRVGDEDEQVMPTRDPEEEDADESVTPVIETPDSTAQTNKPSREDRGNLPPFAIHTGTEQHFYGSQLLREIRTTHSQNIQKFAQISKYHKHFP